MNRNSFVGIMNLKPADVVVVPKSVFNLVAHYVIYWGRDLNGEHFYLENHPQFGVRWVSEAIFQNENPFFKRLILFQGDDRQRNVAISREVAMVGIEYNLENFNCENFANYVQHGVSYSKQVISVKNALVLSGLALGLMAVTRRP